MTWISEVGQAIGDGWSWFNTARVAAIAAVGAAAAAVGGAVAATRSFRQTRRDSRAKSRPMVAAELAAAAHVNGYQMLVVRNHGPSIARDVQVTFDPPIAMPENPAGLGTPFLLQRYAAPIPVMVPGRELDNLYFVGQPGPEQPVRQPRARP